MNQVVAVPPVKETEVLSKARRRGFTAEYKQRILDEVYRAAAIGRSLDDSPERRAVLVAPCRRS